MAIKPTADFRGVYVSLLEQWLGHEAAPIIPGAGPRRTTGTFISR